MKRVRLMKRVQTPMLTVAGVILMGMALTAARPVKACGGFFCQAVPVTQTAEQIIFKQDGNTVTAIVMIQYQGPAEDFSWVVPVPGIPTFSLSSNLLFNSFEMATRPQFILDVEGEGCPLPLSTDVFNSAPTAGGAEDGDNAGEVEVLETTAVGPFDIQVVTSTDPDAMAQWLTDNNYDLNDRGRDLIAPYVEAGMNFVALRLQKDKDTGDIQPLQMTYTTEKPMIPIRLTGIAAEDDMGIIVWLFGPSRAVPLNFFHVVPNYAKINWFQGNFGAYASYQQLITDAMNEAGGHGFATDYAGKDATLVDQLPDAAALQKFLDDQRAETDPATALVNLAGNLTFPQATMMALFSEWLPLPDGEPQFAYGDVDRLNDLFTLLQLDTARTEIINALETDIVEPYEGSLAIFDGDPYITRMYTTLSPPEMTLDPEFFYNADLPDQQMDRHATLQLNCVFGTTQWELTLGEGTGRDGEVIMNGSGPRPFGIPDEIAAQPNIKETQRLRESGAPEVVTNNTFGVVVIPGTNGGPPTICGIIPLPFFFLTVVGCLLMRRRR